MSKNIALTRMEYDNDIKLDNNITLKILPSSLTDGKAGTNYSVTFSANLSGVTWSATYLPPWLNLNTSTGELSGTPTTGGSYAFKVTASLSSLEVHRTYTLNISAGQNTSQSEFRTHSLVLSGQIGVNFFMYLPENSGIDYTKSYVEFDINGDKSNPPHYFDPTFKDYGHYAQLYLSSIYTCELGSDYAAIDCENDYSASEIETVRKAIAGNAIVRDMGTASGI